MPITIEVRPARSDDEAAIAAIDASFLVAEELELSLVGSKLTYSAQPVTPYRKVYPDPDEQDAGDVLVALADGKVVGVICRSENWNRFALIEDLRVDVASRRAGVGSALIAAAIDWAKSHGLPGVMIETQTNNVSACRLYEKHGFVLSGFDRSLHRGLDSRSREIALFWYLIF